MAAIWAAEDGLLRRCRRDQGARRAVRRAAQVRGAIRARGPHRRIALGPPARGHDLRRRGALRAPVHRHGAPGRRHARRPHELRPAGARRRAALARRGGGRARLRALEGRRAPRREAAEPAVRRAGPVGRRRLRHRIGPRSRSSSPQPGRCSAPPRTSLPSRRSASPRLRPATATRFAVVAYEALTGGLPFGTGTLMELAARRTQMDPPPRERALARSAGGRRRRAAARAWRATRRRAGRQRAEFVEALEGPLGSSSAHVATGAAATGLRRGARAARASRWATCGAGLRSRRSCSASRLRPSA